jgi:hypothetical protein
LTTEALAADRIGLNGGELSARTYLDAFAPAADWDDLVRWPPDIFAFANLVLDHTESYRYVVAPPAGRRWPPLPDWNGAIGAAARGWSGACGTPGGELPPLVRRNWSTVTRLRDVSMAQIRSGVAWELIAALLTLHAAADEACADVARGGTAATGSFERRAWTLLESQGSLSRLPPRRMRIVPKTNLSARGVTIRSLSRYLGLCYETVQARWRSSEAAEASGRRDYNIVLLPWPLSVRAEDFRPAPSARLGNMDLDRFGFFEFAPDGSLDAGLVGSLLDEAVGATGRVDAVILPEVAVQPEEISPLERTLARYGASFLIAGVRARSFASTYARNYLHFGVRGASGWDRIEQNKHHRWCLDERQIRQYRLSHALDPKKLWWEAIGLNERTLNVIDVGAGITAAPLVCEDLASLDEVADLVRRIGPSLVVAVLLDGPQLTSRWPCRYSSVLADDPGSAVLTLTSYGMVRRCRPPGKPRSRVVAHWNSCADGPHEVSLAPRASGVLLSVCVESSTLWTADGRRHAGVPRLKLSGIRQLGRRRSDRARGRRRRPSDAR